MTAAESKATDEPATADVLAEVVKRGEPDALYAEAEEAIARVRGLIAAKDPPSSFETALHNLLGLRAVADEHLPVVFQAARYTPPVVPLTGAHYGAEGERVTVTLACTDVVDLGVHEQWGQRFLAKLACPGHDFVWFTGENCWVHPGHTYTMRATVKSHDVFNGVRQTILTRCKQHGPDAVRDGGVASAPE